MTLSRIRTLVSDIPNQLGHFLWMVIVFAFPIWWTGSWWLGVFLLGVELLTFFLHVGEHHEGAWLDYPVVSMVAVVLLVFSPVGEYHQGGVIALGLCPIIGVGTQMVSYAIHRLVHRKQRDELWPVPWSVGRCLTVIAVGLIIAYVSLLFYPR